MTLRVSTAASGRLFAIWLRIRNESSEARADKVEACLFDRAMELVLHPLKGPPEPALSILGEGHRFLLLGRYKIIYRVVDDVIHVTDFFDTKQHYSRMRG